MHARAHLYTDERTVRKKQRSDMTSALARERMFVPSATNKQLDIKTSKRPLHLVLDTEMGFQLNK